MIDIAGKEDRNFPLASTASVYYASVLHHQQSFTRVQFKNIEFGHLRNVGCVRDCSRVLLIGKQR